MFINGFSDFLLPVSTCSDMYAIYLFFLLRTVRNQTKVDFFRKDFTQPDAARQAKKNAFHLMSRQKFMDSAALFLLAGSLDDAIMVRFH